MLRRSRIRLTVLTGTMTGLALTPAPAHAHGTGEPADLPLPLGVYVVGVAAVVVMSFIVSTVRWPMPRFQEHMDLRPLRIRGLGALRRTLQSIGIACLVVVIADGLLGGNATTRHLGPGIVWVAWWLIVPFTVAATGNYWPWASPWRSLGGWINRDLRPRPELAARLGVWPATVALLVLAWLELVSPNAEDPGTVAAAAIVYTLYLGVVTRLLGIDSGLRSGEVAETYAELLGGISPIAIADRRAGVGTEATAGTPIVAWRGWLRGLPHVPVPRGLTWFVIAAIGTVAYDGMSATEWWSDLAGAAARDQRFGSTALVGVVLAIGAAYLAACGLTARLARPASTRVADVTGGFIHALVPVALAYAVAHYFTFVVFDGQRLLHAASDPFGLGWDLFGTADWRIVSFLSPTTVWWIQLSVIVAGHVAATVLIHDRALDWFGGEVALRAQYAMLVLMVALSSLGLVVLAG
jgi:hypothetical protein